MFSLRRVTPDDLPFLRAWVPVSAWESMPQADRVRTDAERLRTYAEALLQSALSPPGQGPSLLAEVGGVPVGYVLCMVAPDSTTSLPQGLILDLFVLPQARRRRIGTALWNAAIQALAVSKIRKAKMWSGVHNPVALHMAARSGFKPEGLIGAKEW